MNLIQMIYISELIGHDETSLGPILSEADAQHLPRMAPWFRFGFSADALNTTPGIARDMLAFFNQQPA